MDFAEALYNKLDDAEWRLCSYYVRKAQDLYDNDQDDEARESLLDAIAVCLAAKEDNAANKIRYYLRFC